MADFNFKAAASRITANEEKIKRIILKDMAVNADKYTPEDTGKTRIEMTIDYPKQSVMWSNEYVEFIFWGLQLNFQKVNNPQAQAMWTERATKGNIDSWAEMYADAIESGF